MFAAMQIERAFMDAWETAAGQLTNPKASPDDLELATIEPEDAWQQLQDSTGVAEGALLHTLEATKFAHSKGKLCFVLTQYMLRSNNLAQADVLSKQRMPDGRSSKTVATRW